MKQYICGNCGQRVRLTNTPVCCPFCCSKNIFPDNEKSKKYALSKIEELNALLPQRTSAWNSYVGISVKCEDILQTLRQYAKRGVIDKSDIPTVEKQHLTEALKEYRKTKNS